MPGWIGFDLDGVLAHTAKSPAIGPPVKQMRLKVVRLLAEGRDVRIFTARKEESYPAIRRWCRRNLGRELPITNQKDWACEALYDDIAIQIIPNTGRRADGKEL